MENVEQTIISQYANSPILVGLIQRMNVYLSQAANFESFYDLIWNIETAQGYGLDVWGRIVGVQRVLQVGAVTYLGASGPPGASGDSMNVAPFYSGQPTTENYSLSDDAFRTLIFAKALANITDGSIPEINNILMTLFGDTGPCWCTDGQDMTMTYTFAFYLTPVQSSIVFQSGVLPRPPGVSASILQGQIYSFIDPGASYPHGAGHISLSGNINPANATPMRVALSTSNTVVPVTGWQSGAIISGGTFWICSYPTPASAGNYYVWAETTGGSFICVSRFTVTVT